MKSQVRTACGDAGGTGGVEAAEPCLRKPLDDAGGVRGSPPRAGVGQKAPIRFQWHAAAGQGADVTLGL